MKGASREYHRPDNEATQMLQPLLRCMEATAPQLEARAYPTPPQWTCSVKE
jgi:hypothetical protein